MKLRQFRKLASAAKGSPHGTLAQGMTIFRTSKTRMGSSRKRLRQLRMNWYLGNKS